MTRAAFQPIVPREYGSPKYWVSKLFEQCGGLKVVTELLGLKAERQAYDLCNPNEKLEIHWSRMLLLSGPKATAAAEATAYKCGGVFLPLSVVPGFTALGAKVAETVRANAEAVACVVDGMQDGKLTAAEKSDARKKIHAALGTLAGMLAAIDAEDATPPA